MNFEQKRVELVDILNSFLTSDELLILGEAAMLIIGNRLFNVKNDGLTENEIILLPGIFCCEKIINIMTEKLNVVENKENLPCAKT